LKRTLLLAAVLLTLCAPAARAVGAPVVSATWAEAVSPSGANLRAEINASGSATNYFFEYVTEAQFLVSGFATATKAPSSGAGIGSGSVPTPVVQHIGGLASATSYRYRVVAANASGTTFGPNRFLTTDEVGAVFSLPDGRGWEMVSPVDKNGGEIQGVGGVFGGGVLQAASDGGSITYSSTFSFADPQGSAGASQYLSRRGSSSWSTENITPPMLSGTYPTTAGSGVPYQLFSPDLATALLSNGRRCRDAAATQCPVENPPMPSSGAPDGYRNYYLRHNDDGTYTAVLNSTDVADLALGPEDFELAFAGATPDLSRIVLSTCAALTPDAIEVPGSDGECDPESQNLYEKSGSTLRLINLLPGDAVGTPGAALAAQGRAISADGNRVYWTDGSALYLREGTTTKLVGVGASFETASLGGSVAYFTEAGHLFSYQAVGETVTDVTPGGGVLGVLGASDDGTAVYYATASGVFLYRGGTTIPVAAGADPGSYPPTTGTARVSADGSHLTFVSAAGEAGYDSHGFAEVYLFDAPAGAGPGTLLCVSCNPSGERPLGAASLPGASPNGSGPNATDVYKPRVLTAASNRVFFDSYDALVPQDTNEDQDAYEWERQGSGGCARASGCIGLISSGRSEGGAAFVDASSSGDDAFFLTDGSLVPGDPGGVDLYDARVGGGFPPPPTGIPCFGDACQPLPAEPEDPTPGTLRSNSRINPPVPVPVKHRCKKNQVRKKGKCVKKKHHHKRRHHR
jgi:hypothetical protein